MDFDQQAGLRSIPRRLGVRNALRLAAGCHALMIVPLVVLGVIYPLGIVYFVGVAAVAALLIYEHALVRPDDLSRVNVAFFQVNIVISIGPARRRRRSTCWSETDSAPVDDSFNSRLKSLKDRGCSRLDTGCRGRSASGIDA